MKKLCSIQTTLRKAMDQVMVMLALGPVGQGVLVALAYRHRIKTLMTKLTEALVAALVRLSLIVSEDHQALEAADK